MNLKFLYILFLILSVTFCCAQSYDLDSVINVYERKYRIDLNASDSVLIDSMIIKTAKNVSFFDTVILQNSNFKREYSNNFLKLYCNRMIESNIGLHAILEHVHFYRSLEDYLRPTQNDYPIFQGAVASIKSKEIFTDFILKSISDCEFLLNKNKKQLQLLKFLFRNLIITEDQMKKDCFSPNLFIIQNIQL